MNPRHLEFVIAVAEHGSFTRAAEALHVSQPSLSYGVSGVEDQLGTQLFYRMGRAVSLTSAGAAFVESARIVLRNYSVLYASVRAVGELEAGNLDLAAPHALAGELLARRVGEFRSRYPGVKVRIQTSENPHDIERYVRTGRCELALAVDPVEPPLIVEAVGTQENLVVFPPGTKLERPVVRHVDLAGQPLVVPAGWYQYSGGLALEIPPGHEPPVVAVETESRQALIPLVLAGAGIAFLPRELAKHAARLGAVVAELDPAIEREIHLVTRPGPLSPAARVFAELLRVESR